MTDESEDGARGAPVKAPAKSAAEQRAERLKAALRDNLRRRKAQVRGRSAPVADDTPESGGDA